MTSVYVWPWETSKYATLLRSHLWRMRCTIKIFFRGMCAKTRHTPSLSAASPQDCELGDVYNELEGFIWEDSPPLKWVFVSLTLAHLKFYPRLIPLNFGFWSFCNWNKKRIQWYISLSQWTFQIDVLFCETMSTVCEQQVIFPFRFGCSKTQHGYCIEQY